MRRTPCLREGKIPLTPWKYRQAHVLTTVFFSHTVRVVLSLWGLTARSIWTTHWRRGWDFLGRVPSQPCAKPCLVKTQTASSLTKR